MVTAHDRGNLTVLGSDGLWYYQSDGALAECSGGEPRPCADCKLLPTPEGYDACLGYIPGATNACCGHGVAPPTVIFKPPVT